MANTYYSIKIDDAQLRETVEAVKGVRDGGKIVLVRVINKTLTSARSYMVDEAYQRYNLTKRTIREGSSSTVGRKGKYYGVRISKATRTKLSGVCRATGAPVPFFDGNTGRTNFGARQTKAGVTVKVLRSGSRKIITHSFIQRMKSGHKGVFWRAKPFGVRVRRLPINELFGPRVEDHLGREDVMGRIESKASQRMQRVFDHEVDYLLQQNKPAGGGDA